MTRVLSKSVSLGVLVELQHETEVEAEEFGLILGTAMYDAEEAGSWMWWCHVQC